jgi:hypothetical protein
MAECWDGWRARAVRVAVLALQAAINTAAGLRSLALSIEEVAHS